MKMKESFFYSLEVQMEQKREVISVWPLNTGKHVKGLVKVIFGESITVFPLMLMEGKRGYYLSFPKIGQENKPIRPIGKFLYYEANRQLTEDVLRTYLPNTPLCREFRMKEALHIPFMRRAPRMAISLRMMLLLPFPRTVPSIPWR